MSLSIGKRDVARLARVIDGDFNTVEEAAAAALEEAFAIYESKAKFTVVGQLYYQNGYVDPADARAAKVSLGAYGTEKQAEEAAKKLFYSTQTHEEFRSWVLPIHHGTPASYHSDRKKAREKAAQDERKKDSQLEADLQARAAKAREAA